MKTILYASAAILAYSTPALAQGQGAPVDAAGNESDAIVVTGSRAAGRSQFDTVSPVDVLSNEVLTRQGTTEVAQALANVAPSIVFPRPAVVDGTDSIRPATLRGLAPDQTLVLINGVRGHASALLNVNGSVGRGSAAVDLNTIPGVALSQIEVLRDGASAQYGSDAIAGVINLRLREARSGGGGQRQLWPVPDGSGHRARQSPRLRWRDGNRFRLGRPWIGRGRVPHPLGRVSYA